MDAYIYTYIHPSNIDASTTTSTLHPQLIVQKRVSIRTATRNTCQQKHLSKSIFPRLVTNQKIIILVAGMFRECVELIAFRRVSALGMDSTVSLLLLIGESSLSHLYFHIFIHDPCIIISNKINEWKYIATKERSVRLTRYACQRWISSWLKHTIFQNKI